MCSSSKLLFLIIYSYLWHKLLGGRIHNDNDAIMRISGHLSSVGGVLVFGCSGILGKLFLWVPIKCGSDRCQVSVSIAKSKQDVFKALHNCTIGCIIHYVDDQLDAWNQDLVIEMPTSLFCFSHISIALYVICWEGRGKGIYVQKR